MSQITPKSTFDDLKKLFSIQFNEFVNQFLDSEVDLDNYFDDIEEFDEKLSTILEDFSADPNPTVEKLLEASVTLFMDAFIKKTYDETEPEEETEKSSEKAS